MTIDLLVSPHFANFSVEAKRGPHNSGGGMSVFVNAIRASLGHRYKVNLCTDMSQLTAPICMVESCFFITNIVNEEYNKGVARKLEEMKKIKEAGTVVIYLCAEMSFIRLLPHQQEMLLEAVSAFTVTCPYLWDLLSTINVVPMGYLCDSIDPDLFRPSVKDLSIVAVGALKHIKNVEFVFETYKLLEGKVRRVYMGSAELWGADKPIADKGLVEKVKACTEEYYANASSVDVAYHNAHVSFAVNDTWHDCSSRSNEELLMSGVISIHGNHPLFEGRPGFKVDTPEDVVDTISDLTNDFTSLPDPSLYKASRDWALNNVSKTGFVAEFDTLLRNFI